MNLPIKLIDIVTLLFVTLLIVIIIFITLQRNIKRYKLRNIKDPHFHICKSIPKELRENIAAKHVKSNVFREPPQLFSSSYHFLPTEQTKPFVLRLKAFDTAKNLENALYDCGFYRAIGTKFEDFILELLGQNNETPKAMLKQFVFYYKWILTDPKVFEATDLRSMNQLINKIVQELALKYNNDQVLRHQLDLEPNGDYNMEINSPINDNLSSNNLANNQSNLNSDNNDSSIARKIMRNFSKLRPSKMSKNSGNETEALVNKNYEGRNRSDNTDADQLIEMTATNKKSKKNKSKSELENVNRYSIINESLKTFNDDSENEELPLVFKDKKGSENASKFNKKFESNF